MSDWLREVYLKRPDGFFHTSPSLLICDSSAVTDCCPDAAAIHFRIILPTMAKTENETHEDQSKYQCANVWLQSESKLGVCTSVQDLHTQRRPDVPHDHVPTSICYFRL
ncbi:hypothetical protein NL108_016318 [Boleophthalmus pectinirostris]|nr:hypothetical protein NL108_016318 [Boleophthalmus pectinirostris]